MPQVWRPASVLVPLVRREPGITVLLTQRTEDMPSHAGQIAFPGGRRQVEDVDAIATALRETEEEVGLTRDFIEVIGTVDQYRTGTGYEITPIVGMVHAGIHAPCRPARGCRRVRGAAGPLPSTNAITASTAGSGRAASGAIMRCPMANATSGAPRRVC